jgi:acyl dehydratase
MTCWSCGSDTTPFYTLRAVPTGSCVLLDSRQRALAYPTGDLAMSYCPACGLVQNDAFDPHLVDYTSGYEASQAFSPTFVTFANRLADGLVQRHGLEAATVLEPGCGDGDFLGVMVERTGGTGVGLDPAHVDGRGPVHLGDRVDFRQTLFTPDSDETAQVIVCRHTLEHIRDLSGFMTATARAARRTLGSIVMFEVPESIRIFATGAFWDVYYEHSTYFSVTSLRNLFHAHGLEVLRTALEFDDQYIIIDARAAGAVSDLPDPAPDPTMADAVAGFGASVAQQVEHWRAALGGYQRVVVWGASSKAVGFLAAVPGATHAVDINPHKRGSFLAGSGVEVVGPDDLARVAPEVVVVMNPVYVDEIRQMLADRGVRAEVLALG